MEIEFTSTAEDYVNFNLYEYQHNNRYRKQAIQSRLWLTLFIAVFGIFGSLTMGSKVLIGLLITLILCIFFYIYSARSNMRGMRKRLLEIYTDIDNDSILGKEKIIISPESIVDEMPYGSIKVFWKYVKNIVELNDYIYIYYAAGRAIFIRNIGFVNDEQRKSFIELMHGYWKEPGSST
jgi:hypothetical protein